MSFFITEKGIEERLARQTRRLPMPEGGEQDFSGFALMWKALDFLVVCGAWDRAELVAIAQERLADPSIDIRERLPQRHGADRPVSLLELRMLEEHRIDPVQLPGTPGSHSLEDHLHDVVASLYAELQESLGPASAPE